MGVVALHAGTVGYRGMGCGGHGIGLYIIVAGVAQCRRVRLQQEAGFADVGTVAIQTAVVHGGVHVPFLEDILLLRMAIETDQVRSRQQLLGE
jgi:hypothetical protein